MGPVSGGCKLLDNDLAGCPAALLPFGWLELFKLLYVRVWQELSRPSLTKPSWPCELRLCCVRAKIQ